VAKAGVTAMLYTTKIYGPGKTPNVCVALIDQPTPPAPIVHRTIIADGGKRLRVESVKVSFERDAHQQIERQIIEVYTEDADAADERSAQIMFLRFLAGLIVTSIALVAAAFSVVKDAYASSNMLPWRNALLGFLGWMAVTIVIATVAALLIQIRRSRHCKWDWSFLYKGATGLAVVSGTWAALQLIVFVYRQVTLTPLIAPWR
jgi:hypothetical protein